MLPWRAARHGNARRIRAGVCRFTRATRMSDLHILPHPRRPRRRLSRALARRLQRADLARLRENLIDLDAAITDAVAALDPTDAIGAARLAELSAQYRACTKALAARELREVRA